MDQNAFKFSAKSRYLGVWDKVFILDFKFDAKIV